MTEIATLPAHVLDAEPLSDAQIAANLAAPGYEEILAENLIRESAAFVAVGTELVTPLPAPDSGEHPVMAEVRDNGDLICGRGKYPYIRKSGKRNRGIRFRLQREGTLFRRPNRPAMTWRARGTLRRARGYIPG